jgi:16S rRNA (adenine1518-N6/adenine1519-N6)-dimethyltransferase
VRPTKLQRLGQHMLVDGRIVAKILDAADISKTDVVCEVGTGKGILTRELCKRAKRVMSFEVDRELLESARRELEFDNLELLGRDPFRMSDLDFDVFVSNLPYSRSRDAVEWLTTQNFKKGVVMVQQEFAEKITARPGSKNYRAVSALAGYCFKISRVMPVGKKSFSPPPTVDSVVLKILPINRVTRETVKGLNLLFSRRNRKASSVAAKSGLTGFENEERRIDQLTPEVLMQMAMSMHDIRAF